MTKELIKAPDFKLEGINQYGEIKEYSLSDLLTLGKDIVLYFYPKDDTPGCTQEACDFRDNFNRISDIATVVGVSPDSIASHKKFIEKHELNFILLSDPEHKVLEAYHAWGEKKMYGKTYQGVLRSTYIISQNGEIKEKWQTVKVKGHVDEVLNKLKK